MASFCIQGACDKQPHSQAHWLSASVGLPSTSFGCETCPERGFHRARGTHLSSTGLVCRTSGEADSCGAAWRGGFGRSISRRKSSALGGIVGGRQLSISLMDLGSDLRRAKDPSKSGCLSHRSGTLHSWSSYLTQPVDHLSFGVGARTKI